MQAHSVLGIELAEFKKFIFPLCFLLGQPRHVFMHPKASGWFCTSSVGFLFFEDESDNAISPLKPSNQQDVPCNLVQADAGQVSRICLGYWVYIPLIRNTKRQSRNFKRRDVCENLSCILWRKHYFTVMTQLPITIKQIPLCNNRKG